MKISREVKTGVIVIIALGLLIYGLFFLKGIDLFGEKREFYANYSNVGSLVETSPVKINGYKIGVVKEIKLNNQTGHVNFVVTFHIENPDVVVTDSTRAVITTDLLGTASVDFVSVDSFNVILSPGDTLIGEVAKDLQEKVDAQIAPLKLKTEQLISSIDSVVNIVQAVLNEDARDNLSASFTSIKKSFENFERTSLKIDTLVASQSHKISSIFSKVESIATNLENNNSEISNIITNFSSISDSLAAANITQTINQANDAMASVSEIVDKINNGEGSMGMLINNDSLYNNLSEASKNLELLVDDYRRNPQRYLHFSVFGRKVKKKVVDPKAVFDDREVEKLKELINGQ